jgi:hypothetical protein
MRNFPGVPSGGAQVDKLLRDLRLLGHAEDILTRLGHLISQSAY